MAKKSEQAFTPHPQEDTSPLEKAANFYTPFDDPPLPPTQATGPEKAKRRSGPIMDDEMKVMNSIIRAMSRLPTEGAKIRVLKYLQSKMSFPLVPED